MDDARRVRVSKYLSKHLRHQPARIGLTLEPGGWVGIDELLRACDAHGFPVSRAELDEVVATSDKKRFGVDPSGTKVRANQGHTVEVDLQLVPRTPPDTLYHGTGERSVDAIMQAGLLKMSRHHVHLSPDVATALAVGRRHGRPVVLVVDAKAMRADGFEFRCSENAVWLVEHVPPSYLARWSGQA